MPCKWLSDLRISTRINVHLFRSKERMSICARIGRASERGDRRAEILASVINFIWEMLFRESEHCFEAYYEYLRECCEKTKH